MCFRQLGEAFPSIYLKAELQSDRISTFPILLYSGKLLFNLYSKQYMAVPTFPQLHQDLIFSYFLIYPALHQLFPPIYQLTYPLLSLRYSDTDSL